MVSVHRLNINDVMCYAGKGFNFVNILRENDVFLTKTDHISHYWHDIHVVKSSDTFIQLKMSP